MRMVVDGVVPCLSHKWCDFWLGVECVLLVGEAGRDNSHVEWIEAEKLWCCGVDTGLCVVCDRNLIFDYK